MKIYVHKNGKSFGPYSASQLRDCLVAKQFSMEDPVCCDGKTWIRLADVPGISETPKANGSHVAQPSNEVHGTHKEEKIKTDMEERPRIKSRKKAFALAGISFALIACSAGSLFAFWGLKEKEGSQTDDQIGQRNDTYSGDKIPEFEKFDPRPAAKKIDDLIYANLKKNNLTPYEEISDEQFVRRVYLSIIGRIPTIAEADRFHESTSADKHSLLIRELLSNDAGYTAHHYQFWADLLRIPTRIDYTLFYREWIKDQIRVNTPYDELVRQLVSGHGLIFDNPAAAYYLRDTGMALDNMSNTVRIFLGTRLECASVMITPSTNGARWITSKWLPTPMTSTSAWGQTKNPTVNGFTVILRIENGEPMLKPPASRIFRTFAKSPKSTNGSAGHTLLDTSKTMA